MAKSSEHINDNEHIKMANKHIKKVFNNICNQENAK